MKQVNQKDYAICLLVTSTVGPQFFGVERSSIENKELEILPSRPVGQIKGSSDWLFTREEEQVFRLDRSSLEVLRITGIGAIPSVE